MRLSSILYVVALALLLNVNALAFGLPDYQPDGAHPRIWLTAAKLAELRNQQATNSTEWQSLYNWCETHIADTGYDVGNSAWGSGYRGSGYKQHLLNYAIAYQTLKIANPSKADAYAARALTIMDAMVTGFSVGEEINGLKMIREGGASDMTINSAERAALIAAYPAKAVSTTSYKDGYDARNFGVAFPLAYDWLYEKLSSTQKTTFTRVMYGWVDWYRGVRSTYNNGVLVAGSRYYEDQGGSCTSPNNCTSVTGAGTFGYVFSVIGHNYNTSATEMAALVPLATYGDNADALTYLNHFRYDLWENKLKPQLVSNVLYKGGYSPEGWNYGSSWPRAVESLHAYTTATGENLYSGLTWPLEYAQSYIHSTASNLKNVIVTGEWTGSNTGVPYGNFLLSTTDILRSNYPADDTHRFSQQYLNTATLIAGQTGAEWDVFLWFNPSGPTLSMTNVPLYYNAIGTGMTTMRSSWQPLSDTIFASVSLAGWRYLDHQAYDAGSLLLQRGDDRLLVHQNMQHHPNRHNTIVFNGGYTAAQNLPMTTPTTQALENNSNYFYVKGDVSNAYKREWNADLAKLFVRNILYLRPNIFVVYDITRSNSVLGNLKEWYTQYTVNPEVTSDVVAATVGLSKIYTKTLNPAGIITTDNPATGYFRAKLTPTTAQEYEQFLHVIEAVSLSSSNMTPVEKVQSVEGKIIGTYIKDSNNPNVVMFSNDPNGNDVTGNVTFTLSALNGKSPWHTIVHLPANTDYTVIRPINLVVPQTYQLLMENSPAKGQVYKTSSQGVLRLPPDISIQTPTDGATIAGKKKVSVLIPDTFTATALELFVDGIPTASTFAPPNVVQLDSLLPEGSHQLSVLATDADGNKTLSAPITVTVITDSLAPTVTITSPSEGQLVSGSVNTSISATDLYDVATVSLYVDGVFNSLIGSAPYNISWNTLLSSNGSHTLTADASDSSGNTGVASAVNVMVDNATPEITSFSVPATSASLTISGISVAASDNFGVTGFLITESATPPTASAVNLHPAPTSFTTATAGTKTLYAWARDAAGNVSALFGGQPCVIDTTKPTVNSFTIPATASSLTINNIVLSASDNIDVTGYLITENSTPPVASAVNLTPAPTSYTAVSAGAKTLYAWARDAAGNVSAVFSGQPCVIDTSAPVINSFSVPAITGSLTVSGITLTASDNIAVTGYLITENSTPPAVSAVNLTPAPTSYTAATAGAKTLYAWARDAAGNVSAVSSGQPCVIDTSKPNISTFTVPSYSPSLTISGITLAAADNTGVTGYLITESDTPPAATAVNLPSAPTSFTVSGTGVRNLYAWARDAAGNVSALYSGRSCIIDTVRPTVDSFTVPATSGSLTISGIALTASDAIGVIGYLITESSTPPAAGAISLTPAPTSYTAATAGVKTLYAWARDAAGNVSLAYTGRLCTIDITKPSITTFSVPAYSPSLTVSGISLAASDNIGVTGYLITESSTPPAAGAVSLMPVPASYTAATAGTKTLYAWARDAAGNVSALFAGRSCVIDTTRPVVSSFTVPAASTSLTVTGIVVSASDNVGVTGYLITESATVPAASAVNLPQSPVSYVATSSGIKTLYAWARDAAGNVSLARSAGVTINPVIGSYSSLQGAYNSVPDGGLLFIGEGTLTGTFSANRNVTVTIEGGYDAAFADNPGFTVIFGKVTLSAGKLEFENIKVR